MAVILDLVQVVVGQVDHAFQLILSQSLAVAVSNLNVDGQVDIQNLHLLQSLPQLPVLSLDVLDLAKVPNHQELIAPVAVAVAVDLKQVLADFFQNLIAVAVAE